MRRSNGTEDFKEKREKCHSEEREALRGPRGYSEKKRRRATTALCHEGPIPRRKNPSEIGGWGTRREGGG